MVFKGIIEKEIELMQVKFAKLLNEIIKNTGLCIRPKSN